MNLAQQIIDSFLIPMQSNPAAPKVYPSMVCSTAAEIFEWNAAIDVKNKQNADRKKGAK